MADDNKILGIIALIMLVLGFLYFAFRPATETHSVIITGQNSKGVLYQTEIPIDQYLQSVAGLPNITDVKFK